MEFKEWRNPIISGAASGLVTWGLREFKEQTMNHITSFLITFSPVFIGLLVFFIYRFIKDYRKLHQFTYQHTHPELQNYNDFKESIKNDLGTLKAQLQNKGLI